VAQSVGQGPGYGQGYASQDAHQVTLAAYQPEPGDSSPAKNRPVLLGGILLASAILIAVIAFVALRPEAAATQSATGKLITVEGDMVTMTIGHSAAQKSFRIDPDAGIDSASVQAMAATGEQVAIAYRAEGTENVLTKVQKAPNPLAAFSATEGVVLKADKNSIELRMPDGSSLSFAVSPQDAAKMDVKHLGEHAVNGSPVRVFFESKDGTKYAKGYEDA
jgi:hypothetical protein